MSAQLRQTVLVASASGAVRQPIASMLQAEGYDVVQAASGEDVIRRVREANPDVVLMHEELLEPSVVDICRAFKGDQGGLVSVVVMRPPPGPEGTGSPLHQCADDVVALPPDAGELKIRVRQAFERLRLMRRLSEDTQRIRELEQARDELTQLIVRDMKAPLTGLADLLEMADRASVRHFKNEASQYINEALDATETLEEMVAFLMDVRRMLAGEMKLTRRRCEITRMVRGTADLLGEAAQACGVSIEVAGEPAFVVCDDGLMGRVFRHLIRTAILMCPKGDGIRVEVAGDPAGVRVVIVCRGRAGWAGRASGLEEMLRPGSPPASSGLGLTFCRLVVGLHGGKFGVDAYPGGVSWWLTLPAGAEESLPEAAEAATDAVPVDVPPQRSRRYLGGGVAEPESSPQERSIASRTTRSQFGVAVAIMSAIPLLAFGYLFADALMEDSLSVQALYLIVPAVVALVSLGIVLLLRHTIEVSQLRHYLEVMARGGAPSGGRWATSADFKAMGKALDSVMAQASEKVRIIEAQSKALLQAEQQRVMVETVGAACHHLGQPATVIGVYLDLMKKKESSPEMQRLIAECQSAASDVAGILHRLQSVAQYETEPYLASRRDDVKRSDERILKI